jgi:N-methylhydantoinase A
MTIQRGIDPRRFALLSFGGSGPAQSPAVMDLLGMHACLVPPNPGNLSAFGLLAVDWRTDHMVTKVMQEDLVNLEELAAIYNRLEAEAADTLEKDGIERSRIRLVREADIRYAGQSMEVRVPAPAGGIDKAFLCGLAEAFHAAHLKTFGYHYAGQQKLEFVNFCVSGFGLIDRPAIPKFQAKAGSPKPAFRDVHFNGSFQNTPVYQRSDLGAGTELNGPAIIEEFGSTTVVFPRQSLSVDPHGILVVRSGVARPA